MADLSKNMVRWIKGFTKDQFDILVKEIIQAYFSVPEVVIVDGKGDGGIDVKIFENKRQVKIPLQVTIDQSTYYKLKKDLDKIDKAITNNGYSNKFYFFYSGTPEQSKVDDVKTIARQDYDIDLEFFGANRIAALIENPRYDNLRIVIREILGDFIDVPDIKNYSSLDKVRFDLLAYSQEFSDLKNGIIQLFYLNYLFENESVNRDDLISAAKEYFNNEVPNDHLKRQLNNLRTIHKIEYVGDHKELSRLSDEEKRRIAKIKDDVEFQEQYFSWQLKEFLDKHGLGGEFDTVVSKIYELYEESYSRGLSEIRENPEGDSENLSFPKLVTYLKSVFKGDHDKIIKEILEICNYNDYLQRVAAGKLFTSVSINSRLESFIRQQPKKVVLDTPVLLYLLICSYDENYRFQNNYFIVVRDLLRYSKVGDVKILLETTEQYVRETAFRLLNAFRLIPLTRLEAFDELGMTNSVFYHFYNGLKSSGSFDEDIDFEEFLYSFGIEMDFSDSRKFLDYLDELVYQLFTDIGLNIVDTYGFKTHYKSRKAFEEIKKDFEIISSYKGDFRPEITIVNDSCMLCYLYFDDESNDHTLLTWDNSFFELRKKYHEKHPRGEYCIKCVS